MQFKKINLYLNSLISLFKLLLLFREDGLEEACESLKEMVVFYQERSEYEKENKVQKPKERIILIGKIVEETEA